MQSIGSLTINFENEGLEQSITVTQFDTGKKVMCHIAGISGNIGAAMVYCKKPSGLETYTDADIIDDHTVEFSITEQMDAEIGDVKSQLQLFGEDKSLTSYKFKIRVRENLIADSRVTSADDYPAFRDAIEKFTGKIAGFSNELKEEKELREAEHASMKAQCEEAITAEKLERQVVDNTEKSERQAADAAEKSERMQEIAVERARINNLVANNNPTEGNSELIDIRVGANGEIYDTAGGAVRGQFQKEAYLRENFFKTKNLLLPELMMDGYLNEQNTLVPNGENQYYKTTEYIENPFYPHNATIILSGIRNNQYETGSTIIRFIHFYDSDKAHMSVVQMSNNVKSPKNAKYFRLTYDTSNIINAQVEICENSPLTTYGFKPYIPVKPGTVYIAEAMYDYNPSPNGTGLWQNEYEHLYIPSGKYLAFAEYTTLRDYTEPVQTPSDEAIPYRVYFTIEEVGGFSDYSKRLAYITPVDYGPVYFEVSEDQAYNMEIRTLMGANEKLNSDNESHGYRIILVKIDDPAIYYPYLGLKKPIEDTITDMINSLTPPLISETVPSLFEENVVLKNQWDSTPTGTIRSLQDNIDVKNEKSLSFYTKISNDFSMVRVGHGESQYGGTFVDVTTDKIAVYNYLTSASLVKEESHNLEISDFLSIVIDVHDTKATITISTSSGSYQLSNIDWSGYNGTVFFNALNGTFTDSILSWTAKSLDYPVWVFGDSYLGLTSSVRWPYYLRQMGFINWLGCGFPGATSEDQISCFNNLLAMKKPKYVIWCLGMNDSDTSSAINASYKSCLDDVMAACKEKNITLILSTIPNVPGRNHTFKNQYVKSLGIDFIDFEAAVGASSNGTWYDGMLSSDNVHPTALGAKALASRAVANAPVLMSNQ